MMFYILFHMSRLVIGKKVSKKTDNNSILSDEFLNDIFIVYS